MIISDSHKFVFLHNPKAGGTSIRNALMKWDTRRNFFWGIALDPSAGWNVDKAHLPLHVLGRLFPEARRLVDAYASFGFCRHPLERFISAFNETFPSEYRNFQTGTLSVDEYSAKLNQYAVRLTGAGQWNPSFTHATPQRSIFYDGSRCEADLIIPIEQPFPRVRALESLLGDPGRAALLAMEEGVERRNARPLSHPARELLSPQSIALLSAFYADDFLFFGYSP